MPQKPRRPTPNVWNRKERGPDASIWDSGSSSIAAWRDGVVLPLIPALLGLFPLISGHFEAMARGSRLVLDGGPARALGMAAIAFGACLHFHNFWGTNPTLSRVRPDGAGSRGPRCLWP